MIMLQRQDGEFVVAVQVWSLEHSGFGLIGSG